MSFSGITSLLWLSPMHPNSLRRHTPFVTQSPVTNRPTSYRLTLLNKTRPNLCTY